MTQLEVKFLPLLSKLQHPINKRSLLYTQNWPAWHVRGSPLKYAQSVVNELSRATWSLKNSAFVGRGGDRPKRARPEAGGDGVLDGAEGMAAKAPMTEKPVVKKAKRKSPLEKSMLTNE
jgi:hypothetical protein